MLGLLLSPSCSGLVGKAVQVHGSAVSVVIVSAMIVTVMGFVRVALGL